MGTITETYSDNLNIISNFTVNSNKLECVARPHDTAYSPVAMWQFDGNMTDSIGTNHLSLNAGTELYGYNYGLQGFSFNGATRIVGSTNYTPLMVVGDITVECLISFSRIPTVQQRIITESGSQSVDSGPTNTLWSIDTTASNGALQLGAETSDAGTNITYTTTIVPAVGSLHHVVMTRESDVVKFYLDGGLVATSGTLTTPTFSGTPLQKIEIGCQSGGTQFFQGFISSVKIIKSALNADQILREANYTLYGGV